MNMAWLAAVLRPRDVAPHPNFSSDLPPSPPARLAAVVLGEAERLEQGRGEADRELVTEADTAIRQVQLSLQADTLPEAVEELSRELLRRRPTDAARDCALTLLTCSAAAELDDHDTCLKLIDQQLRWTTEGHTPDGRLLQAVLLQQKSLRLRDAGYPHEQESISSLECLADLRVEECSPFELSSGVSWSYTETLKQIVIAVRDAAYSLISFLRRNGELPSMVPEWQDLVRAPAPEQLLRVDRQRASIYRDFLSQVFAQRFQTRARIIGGPRLADLFVSTLALELLGHGKVYDARRELAQLRLVQASTSGDYSTLDDAVRLLRHAASKTDLDLTLRWLRAGGPLRALSSDARRVLQMRRRPERLRTVELRVLQAAADLLTPSEADLGLQAIMTSLEAGGPPDLPGQSELHTLRLETAWRAAVSLANTSGRTNDVLQMLFNEVRSVGSNDDLRDRALARALADVEWNDVDAEVRQRWMDWLSLDSEILPTTVGVLSSRLGSATTFRRVHPLALDTIAVHINAAMRGARLDRMLVQEALALVRKSLSDIRRSAARGAYSGGGISPADLAAGLILYADAQELWIDLADFLTDPSVQRDDSSPAFERLAQENVNIPSDAKERFQVAAFALLESRIQFLEPALVPYPAALRFLGTYGLIDEGQSFDSTAQLAGMEDREARQEAAKTVAALSRTISSSWLLAFAIQLSHDADVEVRAHAGRALARIGGSSASLAKLSSSRLAALLREDGLLVPVLLLRGLAEMAESVALPHDVLPQIELMSEDHPSRAVRRQASRLLGEGPRESRLPRTD